VRYARRRRVGALGVWVESQTGKAPYWSKIGVCGFSRAPQVTLKTTGDGSVFPSGVLNCGKVWLCPVCSARIRTRRAQELDEAATEWVDRGGTLAMLSFTVRHDSSMSLSELLDAVTQSYRKIRSRKAFREMRGHCGGVVRALEITWGENGWHPHLHVLLFVSPGRRRELVEEHVDQIITDWRDLVTAELGSTPSVERAVDLTWFGGDVGAPARYVSKIAKEVSMADSKSGRDPFALLDDAGSRENVAKWIEFATVMKGRQSVAWTKGLRELLALGDVKSDQELAESEEVGWEVGHVDASVWSAAVRSHTAHLILEEYEASLRRAFDG
jgi:hypothetical protein